MQSVVDTFVSRLVDLFVDGECDTISTMFDEPVVLVRPQGCAVYQTRAEYARESQLVRAAYVENGLTAVRHDVLDVRSYAPGLIVFDVNFRYIDQNGQELASLYATYFLRHSGDTFSVATHISHNETFNRPLRQEVLAAMG